MHEAKNTADRALDKLERFHDGVDRRARVLERVHADRLRCGLGCSDCCVDGLTVFDVEAERIRRAHGDLLARELPHPAGRCAFLDARGACRVYRVRPYVCRTQGLPLRWIATDEGGGETELRDICPLNDLPDEPLESLAPENCWTIGTFERSLRSIQTEFGGELRRVKLRDLFR